MAVPRKKISVSKRRIKHASWQRVNLKKLSQKYAVVKCQNCWANKLPHRVCPTCGYYKGKQIVSKKVKESVKVLDA